MARHQVLPYASAPFKSRPLRIELSEAIHHVSSRGDRREAIFVEDEDRHTPLALAQ